MNRTETDNEKKSKIIGISSTVLFHLCLLGIFFQAGFDPEPPSRQNMEILIEFEEEEYDPPMKRSGREPRQEDPDPTREIKLVQRSEAQEEGTKSVAGKETTMGEDGDVEKFEPEPEKPINEKALFRADRHRRDTLAAQTAKKKSDRSKAGHPKGNTLVGDTSYEPIAHLDGELVKGASLPDPLYKVNDSGVVTVRIIVDANGKVSRAWIEGQNTAPIPLQNAAIEAAKKAQFPVSTKVKRLGSIRYVFRLK